MKLLLVNPNFSGVVLVPSLGLGFIGTYIKENSNCEVEVIEPILQGMSEEQTLEKAKESDVIGLVCYTESRFQCFDFAKKVKMLKNNCKIIVGGPHVNALDKLILEHYPFVDAVVRMEGEETILEIMKMKPFSQILGLTWNDNGTIIRNDDRPMNNDISKYHYSYSLAFPNCMEWKDHEVPNKLQQLNSLPIIASRGCPHRCSFCAAHQQWGGTYRGLAPEQLVAWMEQLVRLYGVGYFRFYDALFIGSEKKIIEFCDLLEQKQLKVHFRIDIRVGTSKKVLKRLREVGCDVVGFGVESGSNRILKRANKGITREKTEETIRICKELGYWIIGFFMISLPDENVDDVKKTFELLKFFDRMNVQFYKIHPNTTFYEELVTKGEISDEIWFDPAYGYETEYGNEIYFCRETFPSAIFSFDEGNLIVESSIYKYQIANPRSAMQSVGFVTGALTIALSTVMNAMLRLKYFRRFYIRFKKIPAYRLFVLAYRKLK